MPCPYTGVLVNWRVEDGDTVETGQPIATIEAMKMESTVEAPASGVVNLSSISMGDSISQGESLAEISA